MTDFPKEMSHERKREILLAQLSELSSPDEVEAMLSGLRAIHEEHPLAQVLEALPDNEIVATPPPDLTAQPLGPASDDSGDPHDISQEELLGRLESKVGSKEFATIKAMFAPEAPPEAEPVEEAVARLLAEERGVDPDQAVTIGRTDGSIERHDTAWHGYLPAAKRIVALVNDHHTAA